MEEGGSEGGREGGGVRGVVTVWFSRMNCMVLSFTSFLTLLYPTERSLSNCSVFFVMILLLVQHLRLVTLRRERGRDREREIVG